MKIGAYEVTGTLGQTAMSVVHRARAPDGRAVAIKLVNATSERHTERFARELRLAALLGADAGFVPCLEVLETPGGPALVMPLVAGGTLRDRLERGRLSSAETAALGEAVAAALGRAHAKGIVHRDMKPENILFTEEGRPLVADLGVAKQAAGDALTRTTDVVGTVAYMAPEQIEDARAAVPASDVFALGAILYEALAGAPAFEGGTAVDLMARILRGGVEPLAPRRPDAPPWLVAVVERALARRPEERFQDGAAFARALAGAPSSPARGARRAVLVIAALVVLVLSAAGLGAAAAFRGAPARPPAPLEEAPVAPLSSPSAVPAPEGLAAFTKGFARTAHTRLQTLLARGTAPHGGPITALAVSRDDRRVVTVTTAGEVVVRDLDGDDETSCQGERASHWSVAYGESGARVIGVEATRGWAAEWASSAPAAFRILAAREHEPYSAVLSEDAGTLLLASRSEGLEVVDLVNGRAPLRLARAKVQNPSAWKPLAIEPRIQRAAALDKDDRALQVYDLASRSGAPFLILPQDGRVVRARLLPAGDSLLAGRADGTIDLLDLQTGRARWSVREPYGGCNALGVSASEGRVLVSGGGRLTVRALASGALLRVIEAPGVEDAAFTHDGRRVVAGFGDGAVVVLDAATGEKIRTLGTARSRRIDALREVDGGARVVALRGDAVVSWDPRTGRKTGRHELSPPGVLEPRFLPDGRAVAFDPSRGLLLLGEDGTVLRSEAAAPGAPGEVAPSPDGSHAVVVQEGRARLYDLATFTHGASWKAYRSAVGRIALSDTGYAVTWTPSDPVGVVQAEDGLPLAQVSAPRPVTCAAVKGADGLALASGSEDGTVLVVDMTTWTRVPCGGKNPPVLAIAFVDDARVLSAHDDGTLRLWSLPRGVELDRVDLRAAGRVSVLRVAKDGKSFLVGTEDGAVLRFELN